MDSDTISIQCNGGESDGISIQCNGEESVAVSAQCNGEESDCVSAQLIPSNPSSDGLGEHPDQHPHGPIGNVHRIAPEHGLSALLNVPDAEDVLELIA